MTRLTFLAVGAVLAAGAAFSAALPPEQVAIVDGEVAQSLTGQPGDIESGKKAFSGRALGNCLACHANADMKNELFHGDVGPAIDGVADRYTEAQLRAIVVNSKQVFGPDTIMPGFYTLEVGLKPAEQFVGKTVLTAQQVEDVVAYLLTLKE
jgi:sulfur-oxidizing protein SoxX